MFVIRFTIEYDASREKLSSRGKIFVPLDVF